MRPAHRELSGPSGTSVTLAGLLFRTGVRSLSRLKAKALCRLIGHSEDHMDPYNTRCFRCGHEWNYGEYVRSDLGFWLSYFELRRNLRFRRPDDNEDIPF